MAYQHSCDKPILNFFKYTCLSPILKGNDEYDDAMCN